MNKFIILWLILLTALVVWIHFVPQLVEIWQFKHYEFGGWTSCPRPNEDRIVGANNEIPFDWLNLTWQEDTVVKNNNDCK